MDVILCYVRDLPWDDAEMQSNIFTQKMLFSCSKPVMLEATEDQYWCVLVTMPLSGNLGSEFFSSAPVLCYILMILKMNVLHASVFCDRDLQSSSGLLSVQLVLDSESCFHSPSEDP